MATKTITVKEATWFLAADYDGEEMVLPLKKKLWPAKSDPDLEPTTVVLTKVMDWMATHPKIDKINQLPAKPKLLDTNYCLGDRMISWTSDFDRCILQIREWHMVDKEIEIPDTKTVAPQEVEPTPDEEPTKRMPRKRAAKRTTRIKK